MLNKYSIWMMTRLGNINWVINGIKSKPLFRILDKTLIIFSHFNRMGLGLHPNLKTDMHGSLDRWHIFDTKWPVRLCPEPEYYSWLQSLQVLCTSAPHSSSWWASYGVSYGCFGRSYFVIMKPHCINCCDWFQQATETSQLETERVAFAAEQERQARMAEEKQQLAQEEEERKKVSQ